MSLRGSAGGEVEELFAFSDTLTVLVPRCPMKDLCMSCVSVPVWRRDEVIVQDCPGGI